MKILSYIVGTSISKNIVKCLLWFDITHRFANNNGELDFVVWQLDIDRLAYTWDLNSIRRVYHGWQRFVEKNRDTDDSISLSS
jgi:hypothetical protein